MSFDTCGGILVMRCFSSDPNQEQAWLVDIVDTPKPATAENMAKVLIAYIPEEKMGLFKGIVADADGTKNFAVGRQLVVDMYWCAAHRGKLGLTWVLKSHPILEKILKLIKYLGYIFRSQKNVDFFNLRAQRNSEKEIKKSQFSTSGKSWYTIRIPLMAIAHAPLALCETAQEVVKQRPDRGDEGSQTENDTEEESEDDNNEEKAEGKMSNARYVLSCFDPNDASSARIFLWTLCYIADLINLLLPYLRSLEGDSQSVADIAIAKKSIRHLLLDCSVEELVTGDGNKITDFIDTVPKIDEGIG